MERGRSIHGGSTITGRDATPPQLSVKTWGAVWGGSAGGCRGGSSATGGFSRWGGLRATHYYHMHTPPPLLFPTLGKTVPHHPLGDGCQVTPPPPPLGDCTTTVHAHLQAQNCST